MRQGLLCLEVELQFTQPRFQHLPHLCQGPFGLVLSRNQQILMPEVHTAEVSPPLGPSTVKNSCCFQPPLAVQKRWHVHWPWSEDGYEEAADWWCWKALSSLFLGLLVMSHLFVCTVDL